MGGIVALGEGLLGSSGAEAAGSAGALGMLGTIGSVAGPISAIVSGVIALFQAFNVGGGCGDNCVEAAKLQEVIMCATHDIYVLVTNRYLSGADGSAMMAGLVQSGLDAEAQLAQNNDPNAQGAITWIQGHLVPEVQHAQGYGAANKTLSLAAAGPLFLQPGTPGWYPSSIVTGNELATQVLQNYLSGQQASQAQGGTQQILGTLLSSLDSVIAQSNASKTGTLSGILGGIGGVLQGLQGVSSSVGQQILGGILGTIGVSASTSQSVASDITGGLSDVTSALSFVRNDVVGKVLAPILAGLNASKNLQTRIQAELSSGLTGILSIPKTLADALGSQAQGLLASAKLRNDAAADIATNTLVPGIGGEIGKNITASSLSMQNLLSYGNVTLEGLGVVPISAPEDMAVLTGQITKAAGEYDKLGSMGKLLWSAIMGAITQVATVLAQLEPAIEYASQSARATNPVRPLSPEQAVIAQQRGVFTPSEAQTEAAQSGTSPARFTAMRELADRLLGANETVQAVLRGSLTAEQGAAELTRQFVTPDRQQVLFDLAKYVPGPNDIADWLLRGFVDDASFVTVLKAQGFTDADIAVWRQAMLHIPAPAGLARLYGRTQAAEQGFLADTYKQTAPADLAELVKQAHGDTQAANLEWLGHWKDVDVFTWLNALFRGIITPDQFSAAMVSQNYPTEVIDSFIAANRPLINFFYIPDMLAAGATDEAAARQLLAQYGFDQQAIDLTIKFAEFKQLGKASDSNAAFAQLSVANLTTMYADSIIDKAQYIQGLEEHGYSAENASLLAQLEYVKLDLANRKAGLANYMDLVKAGTLTLQQALDTLNSQGYSQGEIAKFQVSLQSDKAAHTKLPTEAQLDKMLISNIIDQRVWSETMGLLGYSAAWTERLLDLLLGTVPNAPNSV